jgi:PhzF family phenazine biosynthesis protein
MELPFTLVDVFGERSFTGNPLAVVHDAAALATEDMQLITRWLNLSETTFLLPPTQRGADYRVRIFTLERELPFAGHPTLGSCAAWLARGGVPGDTAATVQECGAGLVIVRRIDGQLAFAGPPLLRSGPVDAATLDEVAQFLRIERSSIVDAQWADNGPGWIAVLLASVEAVLGVTPVGRYAAHMDIGIVGAHPPGGPVAFELRAFFNDASGVVREDPVTGSLNASVAEWLMASGRAGASYVAAQGTALGRSGRIAIQRDDDGRIWVAGNTAVLSSGVLRC